MFMQDTAKSKEIVYAWCNVALFQQSAFMTVWPSITGIQHMEEGTQVAVLGKYLTIKINTINL